MLFVFNSYSGRNDRQNNNDIRQQPMVTRIPSRRQPTRTKSDSKLNGRNLTIPWHISGIFIKYTCMISNYQSIKNWNNFDIKNYTCGTCFDCRRKGRLLLQCYQRCCCHQSCGPWTSPRVLIDSPVTFIAITWDLNYLVLIWIDMTIMDTFSGRSRHRSLPDLQRNQSPRSTRSAPWERDADT